MPSMTIEDTAPQWELCKENAAPLERGRNAASLSRALAPGSSAYKPQSKDQDDGMIQRYESLVRSSERFSKEFYKRQKRRRQRREDKGKDVRNEDGDEDGETEALLTRCGVSGDPIVHWLKYIKYIEETYPSDTHGQFQIMERCTRAIVHHPMYKNDVRFVRVCILYADRTGISNDTYKYLHSHGVGAHTAVFWMAWAWTAEKRKDFPFAEKIFLKALQKKAKPFKVVEARYKQFQRRMSRHWLNISKANDGQAREDGDDAMDGDQDNVDQENRRGALSGLTEEGVRYNHRGRGVNSMASGVSKKDASAQQQNEKGGFKIYMGTEDKENGGYDSDADVIPHQTLLTKEEHRVKENNIAAERWNERGGLQSQGYNEVHIYNENDNDNDDYTAAASSVAQRWAGTDADARVAGGTSSQLAFQVYVDEECVAKNEKQKEVQKEDTRKKQEYGRGAGSSSLLRQRPDGIMKKSILGRPFPVQQPSVTTTDRLKVATQQSLGIRTKASSSRGGNECALKQTMGSKKTETKNDGKGGVGVVCGFDKKLITEGNNGRDTCFEECRASVHYYNIVPADENFNMLHCKDECSFMDVDELSTIQDVTMEDDVPHNTSILKDSFDNGDMGKVSEQRKVLFGMDTTIADQSNSQIEIQSLSMASSTVDEQDAVGVVGDIEETVNTKFAARELSMMFYSPSTAGNGNDTSVRTSTVKANMSILRSKPLFSVHGGKKREGRTDVDKSCDNVTPKQLHKVASNMKSIKNTVPSTAFPIFCDDDNADSDNDDSANNLDVKNSSAFPIFCDDDNAEPDKNGSANNSLDVKASSAFPIFCDEDDTESDKNGSGNNCLDVKTSSAFPIFCDDDNAEPDKNLNVKTSSAFPIFCDEDDAEPDKNGSGNNCLGVKISSAFPIFCDDAEPDKNGSGNNCLDVKISSAFPIFCDDGENEPDRNRPSDANNAKKLQPRTTNQFTIFEDTEAEGEESVEHKKGNAETAPFGANSDDEENGDTMETMALLNIMKVDNQRKSSSSIKNSVMKSRKKICNENKEKEEFSKCFSRDDSTVLTQDLLAFGDISQIAPTGTATVSSLEENMQGMAVSQNNTARKDIIDYKALHQEVCEEAFEDMMDEAAKQQKQKSRRGSSDITIFDRTKKPLPKGLKKVPRKGTEIDMGGFEFVVKSLLGRGAYGTVLLCDAVCDSPTSRSNFALKVQTPAGCLAWEYEILDRLDQRVRMSKRTQIARKDEVVPFPRVLSFVAFSDGGVLGMTAGSDLGATLVDVVNAYEGAAVPELVAIHYTSRMLLHLETLHLKGKVLHCDIKPDNWVLTSSNEPQIGSDSRSSPIGSDLMLVDFGRALDLTAIDTNSIDPFSINLHGSIAAKDMECAAMRQDNAWCIDLDTYGLCASAHVLLFGCYMDIRENNRSKRWEPKKKFRRYWQQDLWQQLFDTLLNVNGHNFKLRVGEYGRKLRDIRNAFEEYLNKSKHRKEVTILLKEQAGKLHHRM